MRGRRLFLFDGRGHRGLPVIAWYHLRTSCLEPGYERLRS
jgi:hypothetical protein